MKGKAKIVSEKSSILLTVLKGVIVGLCSTLVLILLFALLLRFTTISDGIISPVNQVIRGVSIFLGVFFAMKKVKSNGILSGFLIGLLFTVVAFLIFSLLNGTFIFDKSLLLDIIFGSIIGAICGIICVNLKKI